MLYIAYEHSYQYGTFNRRKVPFCLYDYEFPLRYSTASHITPRPLFVHLFERKDGGWVCGVIPRKRYTRELLLPPAPPLVLNTFPRIPAGG